jgi:hypothetical protein
MQNIMQVCVQNWSCVTVCQVIPCLLAPSARAEPKAPAVVKSQVGLLSLTEEYRYLWVIDFLYKAAYFI